MAAKIVHLLNLKNNQPILDWTDILGLFAGVCTTIAVLPQIIKSWKTKEVEDVSPVMFATLMLGISLWFIYGFIREDVPIIITNGTSLTLNGVMVYLMLRYRKKK